MALQGRRLEYAPQQKKSFLRGVITACAILCIGTLAGGSLRGYGLERTARTALVQQESQVRDAQGQLLQKRTVQLFGEYVFAFADAAIQFDSVPKFDTRAFTSIALSLPQDTELAEMAFLQHDIILRCRAPRKEAAAEYAAALLAEGKWERVQTESTGLDEQRRYTFTVTCTPRMEEGQLTLGE